MMHLESHVPQTDAVTSITVLLIEDDLVDATAALRVVAREGLPYRMQVASSVAQARALLSAHTYDVILADYQLSDGTAFDLADLLVNQLVIFMSGEWDASAAANALKLGMIDYLLVKDVDLKYLSLLQYRVETALRQRRTERLLRESEARLQAILDNAPAAISAYNSDGRLILSNRRHAEHAGAARVPEAAASAADGPFETEETVTGNDGSEHTYLTVRFPMPDVEGGSRATGAISVDITQRKLAEQQIRNLAFYDPLTGLPNRRMLMDRLRQAIATSERHGGFAAVFYIDLDHFKAINDDLGHDHGDLLLTEVSARLLACVRSEDTVARIGGDEFIVMTIGLAPSSNSAAAQAAAVGHKILAAVGRPCQLRAHERSVTPSIGVCLFRGKETPPEEVIKRADLAMYQSKAAGRGTVRFFDPVMQADIDTQEALALDLRNGLDQAQLGLVFQAQVRDRLGVVGAEALLRWQHPTRGVLMPNQFVPLAEQHGMIGPVGRWVLDATCAQLARWATVPHTSHLQLNVNINVREFRQEDFAEVVERKLRRHGANPERLRLELSEDLIQSNPAQAFEHINALKAIGVGFAVDEFGMGYSSLAYLRRMPFDQIKIARSLLPGLLVDPHSAAIIKTIIGIGRDMGLEVLATSVETDQQRDALLDLGCPLWQGQLFGPPQHEDDFNRLRQAS